MTIASAIEQARDRRAAGLPWRDPATALPHGMESADDLVREVGRALGLSYAGHDTLRSLKADFEAMALDVAAREGCCVARDEQGTKRLLLVDPFDLDRRAWGLQHGAGDAWVVPQEVFVSWLERAASQQNAVAVVGADAIGDPRASSQGEDLSVTKLSQDESEVVRFVNGTLIEAMKAGASDVHMECFDGGMSVKLRIDGVLSVQSTVRSAAVAQQAISRVKVLSELDISERRLPQDGRMQVLYEGRRVDVRVSVMPSIHGEDAVLRILDRQHLATQIDGLSLATLGIDDSTAARLRHAGTRAHGMVVMTGPTGSGKTTSVYALMAETQDPRQKVITIEDPVEYQLKNVLQIPVNDRKGLTFATGLRSILRHDPDRILVGEIRDAETAQIAVQAALTGHLVFTTVHANSAFDAIGRFGQLGIDPYDFAAAVNCVVAQRLVRRTCSACQGEPRRLLECNTCRRTGYSGRFAIAEVLELDEEIKARISKRSPRAELEAQARQGGWRPLQELASAFVLSGETTREEVDRVIQ